MERRSVAYFHDHVAPILSGQFDKQFWSVLVAQLGQRESAVRLALASIGMLFESMEMRVNIHSTLHSPVQDLGQQQKHAIKTYNKALAAARGQLAETRETKQLAILTCVLFICIEFLLGRSVVALALLKQGVQLLESSKSGSLEQQPRFSSPNNTDADDLFGPCFDRLKLLSALHGQPFNVSPSKIVKPVPGTDTSSVVKFLEQVRQALFVMDIRGHKLLFLVQRARSQAEPAHAATVADCLKPDQDQLRKDLLQWYSQLQLFISRHDLSHDDKMAISQLLVYYYTSEIWVSTCLETTEVLFDEHLVDFTLIIRHAKRVLEHWSRVYHTITSKVAFTFELGMIPPLYYTAMKCRHPLLRREAVSLLERCPVREGPWNSKETTLVAQRVILLEEADRSDLSDTWRPSEGMRIWRVEIGPPPWVESERDENDEIMSDVTYYVNAATRGVDTMREQVVYA